jgi:succinate dehydrogenase / fumarate reductase flavoprotein subunit
VVADLGRADGSATLTHLTTGVLVVGAGGAGMYAAIAGARAGADVLLVDKGLVGRGGATVMAQMTVAAAMGHEEPDDWTIHLADTLAAGRGLCDETLAGLLCERAPERILDMDRWGTRWARDGDRFRQVIAPGHTRRRCCYVDFLGTGPAVASTLRGQVAKTPNVRRVSNLAVTDLVTGSGRIAGAVALDLATGDPVTIAAKSVVLAAGGLTKVFRRNSASANMTGDAHALALRAGAELVDMEFVQFFPIAHLAPRLVGMDPIMWDPFRYKLGGRLLNGRFEEFMHRYGGTDDGTYVTVRDLASYAILKEVEAGRGSPHGGVYLDFRHVAESDVRAAFGPVIERLLANGIDLTRTPVEVSPTAHYHMGGIRVDGRLRTSVEGLYAAGEAVGGANGANRLSGNAISEAFVFGECAGRAAAEHARRTASPWSAQAAGPALERFRWAAERTADGGRTVLRVQADLQDDMWEHVGPFRTGPGLATAGARVRALRAELPHVRPGRDHGYSLSLSEWHELDAMLTVAEAVIGAATSRTESRGAHQRIDYPDADPAFACNQVIRLTDGRMTLRREPAVKAVST